MEKKIRHALLKRIRKAHEGRGSLTSKISMNEVEKIIVGRFKTLLT